MTVTSQFNTRQVVVVALIPDRNTVQVRTYGGPQNTTYPTFEVPVLPMRVRLPAPGEVWLLDKTYGNWTFAALLMSPSIYLQGRDTDWLLTPAAWLTAPVGASMAASIRRIEQRVYLRLTVGNFTAANTSTGTQAPTGWQPSGQNVSFSLTSPTKTSSILTLNAPTTGFWKLATVGTGAGSATGEFTWLTDDNWPDVTGMQVAT